MSPPLSPFCRADIPALFPTFPWSTPCLRAILTDQIHLSHLEDATGVGHTVKRIAVLPTLLTLGNGVCGFAAIAYASKITTSGSLSPSDINYLFLLSAGLIFLAMVFDALDGAAARLSRTTSEFGGQLDSLCDAISFGVAPAILLLRMGQEWPSSTLVGKVVAVIDAPYLA